MVLKHKVQDREYETYRELDMGGPYPEISVNHTFVLDPFTSNPPCLTIRLPDLLAQNILLRARLPGRIYSPIWGCYERYQGCSR